MLSLSSFFCLFFVLFCFIPSMPIPKDNVSEYYIDKDLSLYIFWQKKLLARSSSWSTPNKTCYISWASPHSQVLTITSLLGIYTTCLRFTHFPKYLSCSEGFVCNVLVCLQPCNKIRGTRQLINKGNIFHTLSDKACSASEMALLCF